MGPNWRSSGCSVSKVPQKSLFYLCETDDIVHILGMLYGTLNNITTRHRHEKTAYAEPHILFLRMIIYF